MTKQGLRDLNYYGPKPAKAQAPAPPAAAASLAETGGSQAVEAKKVDAAPAIGG
ncbi:MAG TPA: hypothetical protein VN853_01115 [Polyangia bacterium]|jgi:hypothetical protein|nr:hypothetical protein [Polyangia bacterium]